MSARTRKSLVLFWTALFVFSLALQYANFVVAPASVQAINNTGTFELDGDVDNDGDDDIVNIVAGNTSAFEGFFETDAINSTPDEILFTGGDSKDIHDISDWLWTSGPGVQDKNDLQNVFAAAYDVAGDLIVYFGADRYAANGEAQVGFWFLQGGVALNPDGTFDGAHIEGDVLVQIDFENGGTDPVVRVYEWQGSLVLIGTGGECVPNTDPDYCAISNTSGFDVPYAFDEKFEKNESDDDYVAGSMIEGGINLTDLELDDACFNTFLAETRSSHTPDSTLSDFLFGGFDLCGQVTIIKDAIPNDAQDFAFSGDLGAFSLDDDGDATLSNTKVFTNVNPGSYDVTEAEVAGWDLTNLVCVESGTQNSTVSLATGTATINVEAKEDVTCTFTNTRWGNIIVEKQTLPDGSAQSFDFDPSWGSNFSLTDGQQNNSGLLAPGTYSVAEINIPDGWDLTSATCSNGDPVSAIDLGLNETITCTFNNRQDGRIITVKETNPADSEESFEFDPSWGANFFLSDGEQNNSGFLTPGSGYSVVELVPDGWDLSSVSCDDGSLNTNINLGPGETVTCTFSNRQDGKILVVKETTPDGDAQEFEFNPSWSGTNFFLSDGELHDSGFLDPGTYSVAEIVPSGWDLTDSYCSDGSTVDSISLQAGETVTCTFENTKRGQIIIEKQTLPDGDPATFTFTGDVSGSLGDGDTASQEVVPGTYTSTEAVPAGWDLTDIDCDDTDSSGSLGTATATFEVDPGEIVTCTFENTKRGTITIIKDAIPNDAQDFGFLVSGGDLGPISLDDDDDPTLPNSITFQNLLPGAYSVTEEVVAGWDLTDLDCTASAGSSGTPSGATANISLAAGGSVTCTYENTKRGTVIVKKVMIGGTGTFTFTGTPAGSIDTNNGTISQEVAPGQYVSTEQALAGWDLTDVDCDDANSVGSVGSSNATFNVEPGETVTCTFENTKRGQIIIDKVTDPTGDPASFTFDPSYDDNFNLTDTSNPNASALLVPGQYTVEELAKAGWDLTGLICDDANSTESLGTRTATVNLEAGETVTCTFTNTKRGTIIVEKQTSPDGASGSFTFTGDASGTIGDDGTITVSNLVPGTYTSTENDPTPDFDLGSIVCDDGDSPTASTWDVGDREATFELDPGETVTCTFTNVQRGTITIIKNTVPDGPQDFHFNTTGSGLSGFDLDDDDNATLSNTKTFENVVAGDYSVTEVAVPGWDLTDIECVSAGGSSATTEDATADITMVPGGSVTCTYTNVERGSVTIVKDAKPNDAQDFHFDFTGSELPGPIAFDLDDDADGTLPSQITIDDLIPGTYTATEAATAGWDLTQIVCNDLDQGTTIDGASAIIDLDPGQHITCTFENRKPDIEIVKTAGDAADGGVYVTEAFVDNVTYHYEVTNTGELDLFDVVVVDDAGTLDTDDDIEICVIEELPIGATETCDETLTVLVDTTNVAVATGETDQGTDVSDDDDAEVDVVAPEIEIIKTAGDAEDGEVHVTEAFPNNVTYTYEITNTGEVDLFDVEVVDDNGTPGNTADDHDVCTIEELPIGASVTCTLTLTVNQTTTNVAVATGHTEQQPEEDVTDDDDAVVRVPDTGIDKSNNDADGVVGHGQEVTYTILVEVVQGPVTNAVVTDTLPAGQTYVASSQTSDPAAATFNVSADGRTLAWTYASLPSGDPALTITYKVSIDANAPTGNQTNVAEICVSELEDCKTDDTTVRVPLLTIVKSFVGNTGGTAPDGSPEAKIGDVLTYTLAYDLTNGPVTNGVITDTLPVGLAYVAGSATNNAEFTFQSFNAATRTLTWTAPTVTADGTVTYQAAVLTGSDELPQPLVNVATIDSNETDVDDDTKKVFVEPPPLAETATPTLPPTDSLYTGSQGSSNPGFSLMLLLLALGGFALVIGFITPVPERVRRRGRLG